MHFYISVVSMIRPYKDDVVQLAIAGYTCLLYYIADTGSTDEPILVKTSAVAVSISVCNGAVTRLP